MRPFTYEVKRTLTSKFVILLIVAIIGLSTLLSYEASVNYNSTPITSRTPALNYGYYIDGNNVTIVTYAFDPYGQPYSGLNINFNDQGVAHPSVSNSKGFANETFSYNATETASISLNYNYTIFGTSFTSPKITVGITPLIPYSGYSITPGILNSANSSNIGFQIMYVGPNGTTSPQLTAYVGTYAVGETSATLIANSTYHESVSGFVVKDIFPTTPSDLLNKTFALVFEGPGGIYLHPSGNLAYYVGKLSYYVPMTQSLLQNLVLSGIGTTLGLLVPILGIFTAYLTYGKDRTTGVLESVMKRPVSRQGIVTSRFLANSFSIAVAVVISTIIGDLMIHYFFGMFLTGYFLVFFFWTYAVEGLSFLALMYMFSHLVRTQSALLGVAISLFIMMDIFWLIIPAAILGGLGISRVSSTYIIGNVAFGYASPAGYGTLVQFFFTKHIGFLSTVAVNPASYGVTELLLAIAGLLWMTVPFGTTYYLAKRYD